jgi:hypothetical protein
LPNDFADKRRFTGALCELRLAQWLIENHYWTFSPLINHDGPIDLVAVGQDGEVLLLDSKADNMRVNKGRNSPSRIYRLRSELQKKLGVRIAYVKADGTVSITKHHED